MNKMKKGNRLSEINNNLMNSYFANRIEEILNSIGFADIMELKLTPTVRFVKKGKGLELVYDFSDDDLEKIKKHNPRWNGLVSFPTA